MMLKLFAVALGLASVFLAIHWFGAPAGWRLILIIFLFTWGNSIAARTRKP